jgi:dephospho-CoA kinase
MENKLKKINLCILGHGRHGKDSMAEILQENFGLKFKSSSQAASEIFIYDILKQKYRYNTPEECFEDRVNHRAEWHQLICEYNIDDKSRLAKGILENNDAYVGMRDSREIKECISQGLFDLIIWVDASKRLPLESKESFNIDINDADIIVDNNGSFEEFKEKIIRLGKILFK